MHMVEVDRLVLLDNPATSIWFGWLHYVGACCQRGAFADRILKSLYLCWHLSQRNRLFFAKQLVGGCGWNTLHGPYFIRPDPNRHIKRLKACGFLSKRTSGDMDHKRCLMLTMYLFPFSFEKKNKRQGQDETTPQCSWLTAPTLGLAISSVYHCATLTSL